MASPRSPKVSYSSSARARRACRLLLSTLDSCRRRTSGEDGFVVVLAITVLFVGMLLGGAAILQTTNTEDAVRRDGSSKRALQAARAGVEAGTLLAVSTAKSSWTTSGTSCPTKTGTTFVNLAPVGGWCQPVTQALGANETFTYQLSAPYAAASTTARDVIATGTVTAGTGSAGSGTVVTRRVRQTLVATPGGAYNPFALAGVIGVSSVSMNSNITIGTASSPVNVRSGGAITGNSNVAICGNVRPGPGQTAELESGSAACGGSVSPGAAMEALEPVTMPTAHNNGSISFTGWDSSTRVLSVGSNQTLTLTGNTYVFCRLDLSSNATLNFNPSVSGPVRIYFDQPSACANTSAPLSLNSNSDVNMTGSYPLHIYVMGNTATTSSGTPSTTVTLNSNITAVVGILYAPNSYVELNSNVTYHGAIAAKVVDLNSNIGVFNYDGTTGDVDVGNGAGSSPPSYKPTTFVECTSAGGTSSTTGC